jgi:FkbM family methyltransferase
MFKEIKKKIPKSIRVKLRNFKNIFIDDYGTKYYSQEGEDMILNRIFEGKSDGFYVDVGAHHPRRFSNTYFFYRRGWSGINIEPNPDVLRIFNNERLRDINLQCGVSLVEGELKYHYFDDPALNTFDEAVVELRILETTYKLIKTEKIPVYQLKNILKAKIPDQKIIDFLSVDVEGFDLFVLKSNDWSLFRPSCVLVEVLNATLEQAVYSDIAKFMKEQGYSAIARTYNTLIFKDANNKG